MTSTTIRDALLAIGEARTLEDLAAIEVPSDASELERQAIAAAVSDRVFCGSLNEEPDARAVHNRAMTGA